MRIAARAFAMLDDMRDVSGDVRAILEGEGLELAEWPALMIDGLLAPHRAARAALVKLLGVETEGQARAIASLVNYGEAAIKIDDLRGSSSPH